MKRQVKLTVAVIVLLASVTLLAGQSQQASGFDVVMSGLDNPRGLAFGPQGALYVAEAGWGGSGLENPFCFVGVIRCYGPTGAVSRLWNGVQERVATGLPSHANPNGNRADGPHDIAML